MWLIDKKLELQAVKYLIIVLFRKRIGESLCVFSNIRQTSIFLHGMFPLYKEGNLSQRDDVFMLTPWLIIWYNPTHKKIKV